MVKEIRYTSITRVLDNLLDHPLLSDMTLERAIRYTLRFISQHGYPKLYNDKIDTVEINDFRGVLPCDLILINQVKDMLTGVCLRAMTDNFTPGLRKKPVPAPKHPTDYQNNAREQLKKQHDWLYIPPAIKYTEEPAFKTQGRIIFTSFPKGCVEISYKAIPVDEHGYPLLIDDETYLAALEAYIKVKVFTVKFDTGKINANVLQHAEQEYAWLAGQLQSEMTIPSISEMESITRMLNTMIPKVREFDNGFKNLGNREYLRKN